MKNADGTEHEEHTCRKAYYRLSMFPWFSLRYDGKVPEKITTDLPPGTYKDSHGGTYKISKVKVSDLETIAFDVRLKISESLVHIEDLNVKGLHHRHPIFCQFNIERKTESGTFSTYVMFYEDHARAEVWKDYEEVKYADPEFPDKLIKWVTDIYKEDERD